MASSNNPWERITILPLRNAVLFPMSVVPINVGRPRSVRVVEDLVGQERALVGVVTQRSPRPSSPRSTISTRSARLPGW